MENLELHFFHGFLGHPEDWAEVSRFLGPALNLKFHNLLMDFRQLGDNLNFQSWKDLKSTELRQSQNKKVLVGYSLGGRLCSHLDADLYEGLILLASHPGLYEGKEQRIKNDELWFQRGMEEFSFNSWMKLWNSQDVFSNDRVRPQRDLNSQEFKIWLLALQAFSLGKQVILDDLFVKEKTFWACGANDLKFLDLKFRMEDILPSQTYLFKDSGHGVLFDQPEAVAHWIGEVVKNVS